MPAISLGQAAKLCGRGKSTIARAIRRGALTAARENGNYAIEVSELTRVFPAVTPGASGAPGAAPPADAATTEMLVATLRATLDDLRQDRDHWREMATRLSLAPPPRGTWWRWLRTAG